MNMAMNIGTVERLRLGQVQKEEDVPLPTSFQHYPTGWPI